MLVSVGTSSILATLENRRPNRELIETCAMLLWVHSADVVSESLALATLSKACVLGANGEWFTMSHNSVQRRPRA